MSEQSSSKTPIWLIASIMLNMVLLGVLAGSLLNKSSHRDRADHRPPFATSLNDEAREEVRSVLRAMSESHQDMRAALETKRKALGDAIAADPFDPAALRAAHNDIVTAEQALKDQMNQDMTAELAGLSVEQRRAIADILNRPRRGPRERGRRGPQR